MRVRGDHAQAFEARFYAEEEAPRVIIRFGLMPEMSAAVALDLRWLDGHILFPGHRAGTQKVVCHGSRIRRDETPLTRGCPVPPGKTVMTAVFPGVRSRLSHLHLHPCSRQR